MNFVDIKFANMAAKSSYNKKNACQNPHKRAYNTTSNTGGAIFKGHLSPYNYNISFGASFIKKTEAMEDNLTDSEKEKIDRFEKELKELYMNTYGKENPAPHNTGRPYIFFMAEEFFNTFAEDGNIAAIKYCLKDRKTNDFIDGTKENQNEFERSINKWKTACMLDALHKKSNGDTIAKVFKLKIPNKNGNSLLISKLSKQEDPYGIYIFASMLKSIKDPEACCDIISSHCISEDFKNNIRGKEYSGNEKYIESNKYALGVVNELIRDLCAEENGISDTKVRNLIKMYEGHLAPDVLKMAGA